MADNSRTSDFAAGWDPVVGVGHLPGKWPELTKGLDERKPLSWFNPQVLWACRNDRLATIADPVPFERDRWVEGLTDDDLTVDLTGFHEKDFSFLLMGDTGEGDHAQFAAARAVQNTTGAGFLVICSDAQYPLGDVNAYDRTFYGPYRDVRLPIYALPGNHDWYDDLAAFQYHFVDRRQQPRRASFCAEKAGTGHKSWQVGLRRVFWRRPRPPEPSTIDPARQRRSRPDQRQPVPQRAPYFVIDAGPVRLVCIDTGIIGDIDDRQAKWLLRVSRDPRPKLLLTGKPLVVDGKVDPCHMQGHHGEREANGDWTKFTSVLDVVHHAPFRYLGSIGGDIHNYQRYPVRLDGREYQHIVSGGGGAFMHATHLIETIDESAAHDELGVTEKEFKCYPLRLDSLAVYSRVLQDKLGRWLPISLTLTPTEAAKIVYEDRKVSRDEVPQRVQKALDTPGNVPRLRRLATHWILRVGGQKFHRWFSPFFTWNDPPFFRNFLRVDVTGDERAGTVTVSCHAVTGYLEEETQTPVEDSVTMSWS